MASPKSIAIACETACERIENTLGCTGIPRRNKHKEILRRDQLEWIADNIQTGQVPAHYLLAEELARAGATKAEIVDALLGG